MDAENLAVAQEEAVLTKIRTILNTHKVKLWEAPYYDPGLGAGVEAALHELAVTLAPHTDLPRPHLFEGLKMLQQHATEKLAARDRFKETGIATLKVRCAKGLKCRVKTVEVSLAGSSGADLANLLTAHLTSHQQDKLKLIIGGRVISPESSLAEQGVKNSATVMVVLVGDTAAMQVVAQQRRELEETKADAARLSGRDRNKDSFYLQVADQSGKPLDLPPEEKRSLVIAMSLHEKGRAALKRREHAAALVLLLEAEAEFGQCRSELLSAVDNLSILSLDIAWCYLHLHAVSELPDAEARLLRCEQSFKQSYGQNLERLTALKGSPGSEQGLLARLHLLQGITAFHLGRPREAALQLEKVSLELQLLAVDESSLLEVISIGYSVAEARLGLRAALGDVKLAVEHIQRRREQREEQRKKEEEERQREKLRARLGRCADGSWVNVGYYKTLTGMGFTESVAGAALRQANNSLNKAVQLLQEEPDLVSLAAQQHNGGKHSLARPSDEMIASVVAMGFEPDMAKVALRNTGSVEGAVEALMNGGGVVTPIENESDDEDDNKIEARSKKQIKRDESDEEAYNRIKTGISENEEDHLDIDFVEEGELLRQYLGLLKNV